jgi:hypothetical protein
MGHVVAEAFRKSWPPAFAGPEIGRLSGGTLRWRTVKNKKILGIIPAACFVRGGYRLTIVLRDPFLDWWETTLPKPDEKPPSAPWLKRRSATDTAAEQADPGAAATTQN